MTRMHDHIYAQINNTAVVEFAESLKDPELLAIVHAELLPGHPNPDRAAMAATAAHATLANMIEAIASRDVHGYAREIAELEEFADVIDVVNLAVGVIAMLVSVLNPVESNG